MSFFRSKAFVLYLVGLLCVAAGAQISSLTHSMFPLAVGAAAAVMTTLGLVKAVRARHRQGPR
jgi:hypothetical protein